MIIKIKNEDHNTVNRIKETDYSQLTDQELLNISIELKEKSGTETPLESLMTESYPLVFESCKRNLGLTPFDVQLLGAIFLNKNTIIQMQTGEGKTLCAVFAAYTKVLSGKRVHVLTFNDYLAKRDSEWMRPVYESLGISVSYISSKMGHNERKEAYKSDITYVTAKEAGFDYLRDGLVYDEADKVHNGFDSVIIDEADSILIDEAGIPLVVAGKAEEKEDDSSSLALANFVNEMDASTDYQTDDYGRNVYFTDEGENKIEEHFHITNLYEGDNMELLTKLNCALHAEVLFTKDVNYIVKDDKVQLIDEATGRIASNRHWPDGLQEAVEAKEGFKRSSKGRVLGNISILNFLELYREKAGMTGTAVSSQEEFEDTYKLDVVKIPPNKKSIRIDHPDQVYINVEEKNKAILSHIKEIHKSGQPILIGTCSIEESEDISNSLRDAGIDCTVLNAKNDEAEADLIAQAGKKNAVTVSTNMAGRGVDIKLGGGDAEEAEYIDKLGGLYIISTSKNESLRIDDQLRGRSGRQGDAGSSMFYVSIEDDLMIRFGVTESLTSSSVKLKYGQDGKITNKNIDYHIRHIQKVIEGQNHEIRTTLNKYAQMQEQQRQIHQENREQILSGDFKNLDVIDENKNVVDKIIKTLGETKAANLIRQILLNELDKTWVNFLEYVDYVREGIHLVSLSREDPMYQYHLQIIDAFDEMKVHFDEAALEELTCLSEKGGAYVPDKIADVTSPSATWTYIISDNEFLNRIRKGKFNKNKGLFGSLKGSMFQPKFIMDNLRNKFSSDE